MTFTTRLRELLKAATPANAPIREYRPNADIAWFLANHAEAIAELVEAAQRSLDAHEHWAKCSMSADVAVENYSDPEPEVRKLAKALLASSDADKTLRAAIAKLNAGAT